MSKCCGECKFFKADDALQSTYGECEAPIDDDLLPECMEIQRQTYRTNGRICTRFEPKKLRLMSGRYRDRCGGVWDIICMPYNDHEGRRWIGFKEGWPPRAWFDDGCLYSGVQNDADLIERVEG